MRNSRLLFSLWGIRPFLRQIQTSIYRPGHGTVGIMAGDTHLAIVHFAKFTAILAGHADGAVSLFGKAGVIDNQNTLSQTNLTPELFHPLGIEGPFIPVDTRQQGLEPVYPPGLL